MTKIRISSEGKCVAGPTANVWEITRCEDCENQTHRIGRVHPADRPLDVEADLHPGEYTAVARASHLGSEFVRLRIMVDAKGAAVTLWEHLTGEESNARQIQHAKEVEAASAAEAARIAADPAYHHRYALVDALTDGRDRRYIWAWYKTLDDAWKNRGKSTQTLVAVAKDLRHSVQTAEGARYVTGERRIDVVDRQGAVWTTIGR